ncbi:hypothetical protein GIB67_016879 [Kingdonia uniflora]|uniref:RING-type E3 ubiquitin transferase n=1 Tax=Kingdonia uniflora TaxID=39325 RepID=A0A7J7M388_9MAGN|nr:hypothetical protein GIB67_016879 [Kingdonia uniflora]
MASPSLHDLLTEEGFKGRKSMRSRSSFGSVPVSMPLYLYNKDHLNQFSSPSGVKVKPERAKSDVSKYKSISELQRSERANFERPQDNLLLSERVPRGPRDSELFGGIDFSARRRSDAHASERLRDIFLNEGQEIMSSGESFSNGSRDRKKYKEGSSKNLAEHASFNQNSWKNSNSFGNFGSQKHKDVEKSVTKPALDEVANKAMVSILSSYITVFLKDKEFRDSVRRNCSSCLNTNKLEEENLQADNKVISNFEDAMETVERVVEEYGNANELKKACLQLSVVTSLNLKDLKDGFTSGIPNSQLSACAHLYLSVIYKLQKKDLVSAKHLLQVFCDSPFQARKILLHELWDYIFLPNFLHLSAWYDKEVGSLPDTSSKARKLKLLDKVYSDILDSGTYQFAVYYKDWLTEGVEAPAIPSIHVPPVLSVKGFPSGSLHGHSSDISSPCSSVSSQPMISRKLYDDVCGHRKKIDGVVRMGSGEEEESFDNCTSSFDTTEEEKKTVIYSSGQGKYTGEPIDENINGSKSVKAIHCADGLLQIAEGSKSACKGDFPKEEEIKGVVGNTHFWQSPGSTHMLDVLPPQKANELTLKKLAESVFQQLQSEDSIGLTIPIRGSPSKILMHDSYANRTNKSLYVEDIPTLPAGVYSKRTTKMYGYSVLSQSLVEEGGQYVNDEYVEDGSFFSNTPKDFICPLTGELFDDPVTLETGETFEKAAIKEWFSKGNKKCPITGRNLECLAVPITNFILKRVIDSWKSEHCRNLLSFASKMAGSSFENGLKSKDERAVSILEQLLVGFKTGERLTNAKHLISLGGLQFLIRRFEFGNLQEKTRVVALLLCCIEADGGCRNYLAKNINKACLLELLHNKQTQSRASAVLLLTELICLNRRAEILSFLSSLQKKGIMNTMHVLLVYLQGSAPDQKPLVAVLLLHFNLLVEPRKYSIYREEAVDSITMALESSLIDEKVREQCCRALLILGGHFSFTGELLTENWLLRQAGFYEGCDSNYLDNSEGNSGICEIDSLEEEEKVREEWWKKIATILLGNGKKISFLEMISKCLGSGNSSLVRMCLITVAWISHALTLLTDAEFQLSAFSALVPRLKESLESGEWVEHRVLASMTLLNFTKISECRVVLMTIGQEIRAPLQSLAGVTWTAKHLLAVISGEGL